MEMYRSESADEDKKRGGKAVRSVGSEGGIKEVKEEREKLPMNKENV